MLTLSYTPDAYRHTDNLLPVGQNLYETRPGFFQVVADNINRAIGWNDACLMEVLGGVYVWHGGIFEAITDSQNKKLEAGLRFAGSRFQGLQSPGNREERIYVGNGKAIYYVHRNVIAGADVTGVTVEPETVSLLVGESENLSAIIEPSWALNKKVIWNSADNAIATVTDKGIVTAVILGTTTITATTEEGGFTASSAITVTDPVPVTGVDITETELSVDVGETGQLHWQVLPGTATNTDVYWLSGNLKIATINSAGMIAGISEGETTITIKTRDGHFSDSCTVKVIVTDSEIESTKRHVLFIPSASSPNETFYEFVEFDNEFLNADDEPYPLPKADCLATWRSRLWIGDGTHIIYHCLFDNPHHWEPLDAIQIQGGEQSKVTGLCAMGNRLIVSTFASLWQVVGDSPYNWEFQSIVHGHGAINDKAMATDGTRLFYLDREGVYERGKPSPVSEPIKEIFFAPDYESQILLDGKGEYLYCLIADRLFVYNTWHGGWGEITLPSASVYPVKGLMLIGGKVALYGDQGLWISGNKYTPDVFLNNNRVPVNSRLRTWPVQPNPHGNAALNRCYLSIEGAYQAMSRYSVYSDARSLALTETTHRSWLTVPEQLVINPDTPEVLFREQSERVHIEATAGVNSLQFEHEIASAGFVKLWKFEPDYQFSQR